MKIKIYYNSNGQVKFYSLDSKNSCSKLTQKIITISDEEYEELVNNLIEIWVKDDIVEFKDSPFKIKKKDKDELDALIEKAKMPEATITDLQKLITKLIPK